jgi:hypothetical protein
MDDRDRLAEGLSPARRAMLFALAAKLQAARSARLRLSLPDDVCAELAYWALEHTGWRSVDSAHALARLAL